MSTIFIKVFLGLLVGSVWYGTGKPLTNDHIFTVEGAMFCCVFMSTVDTLMATLLAVPGIKGTYSKIQFSKNFYKIIIEF